MTIDYSEACSCLRKQIEIFLKLPDADWELLIPHLQLKTIRKNQKLIQEAYTFNHFRANTNKFTSFEISL